ncbi:hypothetical protein BDA96_09G240600 [Sorghum bicolor]|uniref:Uncharacterized protein n=1 Tax=Sorghum bicolor TaxID=4558 RepID=A0A921U5L1_SORBI|nr:hypothetical protein BDA96_09G240600 [Sorghum bicolor]
MVYLDDGEDNVYLSSYRFFWFALWMSDAAHTCKTNSSVAGPCQILGEITDATRTIFSHFQSNRVLSPYI